jgi:NCAIR mutase (PurE)-related protein
MNRDEMTRLFEAVRAGGVSIEEAVKRIETMPFTDMGFSMIDNHREIRTGRPEVIYCEGKTPEQVRDIVAQMMTGQGDILGTRASEDVYDIVRRICPEARYNRLGRTFSVKRREEKLTESYIAIVAAGTSDLPVVEEARETALIMGNRVERVVDVGVAGIHRLFARLDLIRGARVIIVVAGMEGALASVVAGLVDRPVIAVPTSVGYGASFNGVAALLSMLNSCAGGVSVVNIDNGFGAACCASMINKA